MSVNRPTVRAQEALAAAVELAAERGHPQAEPEHLLVGLVGQPEGVVAPVLVLSIIARPMRA